MGGGRMERHEIETFLTLAEELHFRKTSERLALAQGRVSQIVKKLERQIGVPLFERTSRRVALTPAGRAFYNDLKPAYDQVLEAVSTAVAAGRGIAGTLRVGYSTPWCGDLVVRAGDAFRAAHPGCEVHFREIQLNDPYGPLRAGDVDLQLTEFPVDEPDLAAGPVIISEPRALIVPANHPYARRETVSLEDLAAIPLVPIANAPDHWLDHHYPSHTPSGREIPRAPAATYWQETLTLVAGGHGAAPAAARAERYHGRPGVAFVPFSDAPPIQYGLIWSATGHNARARSFIETIVRTPSA
ncbi:LysR family transcriptional regulator [Actinomadura napierensis]|uniref:LysR family transcriptional regulator n=2 Tax=Actinomadura napierensis TaxID=267854 RepID=A0ABP5JND9_9ACTN